MKKILIWFLVFNFLLGLGAAPKAYAMDPKAKALGMIALYGTLGGALLGTASLAFGTRTRAIFQGASLGLYAGLLFGTYVVIGHSMREKEEGEEQQAVPEEEGAIFFPQIKEQELLLDLNQKVAQRDWIKYESDKPARLLSFYVPIVQFSF